MHEYPISNWFLYKETTMTLTAALTADQERALENICAAAERLWARPLHRYYTDHGVTHSERITALLEGLTAGMMQTPKRLAPVEAFALLAAACLHDIGMQDERFAGGDLETIRAHHHEQTAEMIYRVFEDPARAFALPLGDDPGLVEAIVLVARGHRKADLAGAEYEPFPLGGERVRARLLAALLRFADELDIDYRRVDLEQMKLLDLPLDSQLHWWKCHYVSGVGIVDEYIRVAYRFPRDRADYEQLLIPLVECEIRAKHAALEPIYRRHGVKVAIGQPQVRLMRLVQPMPPEVEALARERGGGGEGESRRAGEGERGGGGEEAEAHVRALGRSEGSPAASAPVFGQQGQIVGTQINIAGDVYGGVLDGPTPDSGQPAAGTAVLRTRLQRLDAVEIESLCLDHFPQVYDKFGRGLRRDEMLNLLLDHCRRNPAEAARLAGLVT
jgi:hypothetical protein